MFGLPEIMRGFLRTDHREHVQAADADQIGLR